VPNLVEVEHFFLVSHYAIDYDIHCVDMGEYIWVNLIRKGGVGVPKRAFSWKKATPLPDSSLLLDERCVGC
jgi:hypothetical protein